MTLKHKEEFGSILLMSLPKPTEIITHRNRIRSVDSGIRVVDRIKVCEMRLT